MDNLVWSCLMNLLLYNFFTFDMECLFKSVSPLLFCDINSKADWAHQWVFSLILQCIWKICWKPFPVCSRLCHLSGWKGCKRVSLTQFCPAVFQTLQVSCLLCFAFLLSIMRPHKHVCLCLILHYWVPDWCAIISMCPSAGC